MRIVIDQGGFNLGEVNFTSTADGGNTNEAPTVSISNPSNNSSFDLGILEITATANDIDGVVSQVEFFANNTSIGSVNSNPYTLNWNAEVGSYNITAIATDDSGASTTSDAVSIDIISTTSAYPNGDPHAIPGTIYAPNYDNGGQGVAYNDNDAGNNGDGIRQNENVDTGSGEIVGWIASGEWLNYTVAIETQGTYDISYSVASSPGGGAFHLEFDGNDVTGPINVAATGGWGTFTTIESKNINLNAGQQIMRIVMDQGGFNLGEVNFNIASSGGDTNQAPTVSITNPQNNSSINEGDSIQINATANDIDGSISEVSYFANGLNIGVSSSSPYTINWNPLSGSYNLTAIATDNEGINTTSTPIAITVNPSSGAGNCANLETWNALAVYPDEGTQVVHNGKIYENNWYTSDQNPATNSGQWQVWSLIDTCDMNTTGSLTSKNSATKGEQITISSNPTANSDRQQPLSLSDTFAVHTMSLPASNLNSAKAEMITIFPNPVSSEMNVLLNSAHDFSRMSILDFQGTPILEKEIKSKESIQIQLGNLENGLYFIRLHGSQTVSRMFLKK